MNVATPECVSQHCEVFKVVVTFLLDECRAYF